TLGGVVMAARSTPRSCPAVKRERAGMWPTSHEGLRYAGSQRMAPSASTLSRRLIAWLERGLPPTVLGDHELRRRALLISGTAGLAVVIYALTIPVIVATTEGVGRVASLAADIATLLLTLLGPWLLRRTGTPTAAGHW